MNAPPARKLSTLLNWDLEENACTEVARDFKAHRFQCYGQSGDIPVQYVSDLNTQ